MECIFCHTINNAVIVGRKVICKYCIKMLAVKSDINIKPQYRVCKPEVFEEENARAAVYFAGLRLEQ
jgi:hypothetical protein